MPTETTMHSSPPSPSLTASILSLLAPRLPLSLPVYRRIQFAHFSPAARITTSFPHSTISPSSSSPPPEEPWLVSISDPDRGPETQAFLYGSWEKEEEEGAASSHRTDADLAGVEALIRAYVAHVRAEGLFAPGLRTELMQARVEAVAGPGYDKAGDGRHLVMMGAVHKTTARMVHGLGLLAPGFNMGGTEGGMTELYNKWVFDLRGQEELDTTLPERLRWGTMRTPHYALVRSRTAIPRQDRTLSILPTVAIFPTNGTDEEVDPVAWGFLGVDSSLTTIHVEPEYRGRGLAKVLARKAWKEHLDCYRTNFVVDSSTVEEKWAHADVATTNVASSAMCKSLGGSVQWGNYWMKIDLTRLAD